MILIEITTQIYCTMNGWFMPLVVLKALVWIIKRLSIYYSLINIDRDIIYLFKY